MSLPVDNNNDDDDDDKDNNMMALQSKIMIIYNNGLRDNVQITGTTSQTPIVSGIV